MEFASVLEQIAIMIASEKAPVWSHTADVRSKASCAYSRCSKRSVWPRAGAISDSERHHCTVSEECVVATEAGSTQHVEALPQQQIFEMEGSVTLTPSERSHRPPLAPRGGGDLQMCNRARLSNFTASGNHPAPSYKNCSAHVLMCYRTRCTSASLWLFVRLSNSVMKSKIFLLASLLRFLASSGAYSLISVIQ